MKRNAKIIGVGVLLYLLGNTVFETIIEYIESIYTISLYGIFPYTRVALLILAIVLMRKRIKENQLQVSHDAV